MGGKIGKRGGRGFTLVEVTVAMGLMAFILLGLAATAGLSARGGRLSRQRNEATYLATQMLETLCANPIPGGIQDITLFNGDDTSQAPGAATYPAGGATDLWGQQIRTQLGSGARGTISVAGNAADATVPVGRWRLTVTVIWPLFGDNHQVQIVGVR